MISFTPNNSLIITRYHDKLFFPERKVIVGLFDDNNMIQAYANLATRLPLYYYNFTFSEETVGYLNTSRLLDFGLELTEIKRVTKDLSLYKLESVY